jgi:cohesin complex subunit SA-1/2
MDRNKLALTCSFTNSLKDVQSRTENINTDEDPSGWRPYHTFVDSLREKYVKNEGLPGSASLHFSSNPNRQLCLC